jgi:hypothetical protein
MLRARRFLLSMAAVVGALINFFVVPSVLAQVSETQLRSLQQLTQTLIALSGSADQSLAASLAKQRHDLLLAVAAISPQQAMDSMLPPGIAKKLPASAAP